MHRRSYDAPRRPAGAPVDRKTVPPAARDALRRAAILVALSLAAISLWSPPVAAHTRLLGSDPADGATRTGAPAGITLRFNEPVEAEFDPVKVLDPRGERVDAGDARISPDDARVVEVGLEDLPEGAYTAEWRITSIDGHVVDGDLGFEVAAGAQPAGGEEPVASAGEAPSAPYGQASSGSPEAGGTPVVTYAAASLGVAAVAILAVMGVGALRRRGSRSGTRP